MIDAHVYSDVARPNNKHKNEETTKQQNVKQHRKASHRKQD